MIKLEKNINFLRDSGHHIGGQIEIARTKKLMTQKALAKKIGSRQPVIAGVESGSRIPSIDWMNRVAKALGMYWKFELLDNITQV